VPPVLLRAKDQAWPRSVSGTGACFLSPAGSPEKHDWPRPGEYVMVTADSYGEIDEPLKLVVAIVQDEDAGPLHDALVSQGFPLTRLNSVGGFLRKGNATILVGVPARRLSPLLAVIRDNCRTRTGYFVPTFPMDVAEPLLPEPVEVEIGGALVLVLDVDRFASL